MSDQVTPDFYTSNEGTAYPFVGPSDSFTRPFVDASVTLPPGTPVGDVILSRFDLPAGFFEIKAGSEIVIPYGTPVAVTTFGSYVIWEARTAETQAVLVFGAGAAIPVVTSGTYVFQERAVSLGAGRELYVAALGQEIAGPGRTLKLADGSYVTLDAEVTETGDTVLTINADFAVIPGVPIPECKPTDVVAANNGISTVNGIAPNSQGNLTILGDGVYVVDKVPGEAKLLVTNVGEACCDCPDYITFYGSMKTVVISMSDVSTELLKAQDSYKQLLAFARFLLLAPVAGSAAPGDTGRIATP